MVAGIVLAMRKAFVMPGGDTWRHIFEITYEYRPLDSRFPETVVQRVDEGFYRGLQVGSAVQVRYSPSRHNVWQHGVRNEKHDAGYCSCVPRNRDDECHTANAPS